LFISSYVELEIEPSCLSVQAQAVLEGRAALITATQAKGYGNP